jgi:hypothetical protein
MITGWRLLTPHFQHFFSGRLKQEKDGFIVFQALQQAFTRTFLEPEFYL